MKRLHAKILLISVYILTILLALLCIWRGIAMCGDELSFDPVYLSVGAIGFVFSWLMMPVIHETGHLVCARANDFKCYAFSVSVFHFSREGKKVKLKIGKDGGTAGACTVIPETKGNMKKRYFCVAMGGILFTGILFAVAFFLFLYSFFFNAVNYAYFFFLTWLPASFFFTFFNLVPFENEYGKSDGAVMLGIHKKNPSELTLLNILRIQAELYRGVRFGEINEKFYFSAPQVMETDPNFAAILQLRYYYYRDKKDKEKCQETVERLESIFDELCEPVKKEIAVDLFYEAVLAKDDAKVKKYYKVCKPLQEEKSYLAYKVLTCRYSYKGRAEEADEYYNEAIKMLNAQPFEGKIAPEKDALKKLKTI